MKFTDANTGNDIDYEFVKIGVPQNVYISVFVNNITYYGVGVAGPAGYVGLTSSPSAKSTFVTQTMN